MDVGRHPTLPKEGRETVGRKTRATPIMPECRSILKRPQSDPGERITGISAVLEKSLFKRFPKNGPAFPCYRPLPFGDGRHQRPSVNVSSPKDDHSREWAKHCLQIFRRISRIASPTP